MRRTDWDARYAERDLVWGAAPNRFVERELADMAAGRALDLACGEGRNAIWLARRGWAVAAVDFSAVAADRARVLAHEAGVAVDVREADVLTADLGGDYDLVLISYLQLPPAERAALLERAAAALTPGGTLLLVGHDLRNLDEGHGGPHDPSVHWTVDEIIAALGDAFVVERAGIERREVEGAARPALDTLVRARLRP